MKFISTYTLFSICETNKAQISRKMIHMILFSRIISTIFAIKKVISSVFPDGLMNQIHVKRQFAILMVKLVTMAIVPNHSAVLVK